MRELPIIFSGESVRKILSGEKTQTRRLVKPSNSVFGTGDSTRKLWPYIDWSRSWCDGSDFDSHKLKVGFFPSLRKELGEFADVVWPLYPTIAPAYSWQQEPERDYTPPASRLWVRETWAQAKGREVVYRADSNAAPILWRSPIYMPRRASRLTLAVKRTRVERLTEITRADVKAEAFDTVDDFFEAWERLNPTAVLDPWVWVYDFEVVDRHLDTTELWHDGEGITACG